MWVVARRREMGGGRDLHLRFLVFVCPGSETRWPRVQHNWLLFSTPLLSAIYLSLLTFSILLI
jgi:hypothetical protein